MKNLSYCYRPLCAALCLSMLSLAPLASGASDADMSAQAAGERASFAQAFCGVSPARIGAYKERLRKVLTGAADFDQRWDAGWQRADKTNSQMNALRERDPQEFAARIKINCERLKWMAGNALRSPARK